MHHVCFLVKAAGPLGNAETRGMAGVFSTVRLVELCESLPKWRDNIGKCLSLVVPLLG